MSSLKDKNRPTLVALFVANAVLLAYLMFGKPFVDSLDLDELISPKSLAFGVLIILVIVAEAVVSRDSKAILVFWRVKHPWPASEAFTKHAHDDPRIDNEALVASLGEIPTGRSEQNRLWYRLFRKHDQDETVRNVHREFLLLRDLCVIALLFIPVSVALIVWFELPFASLALAVSAYFIEYLLLRFAARRRGIEFVQTVLAVEAARSS